MRQVVRLLLEQADSSFFGKIDKCTCTNRVVDLVGLHYVQVLEMGFRVRVVECVNQSPLETEIDEL